MGIELIRVIRRYRLGPNYRNDRVVTETMMILLTRSSLFSECNNHFPSNFE